MKGYSEYTARVREYAETMALEEAVECAITECIKEGILEKFLTQYRMEAKSVSIYEYDAERHMRQEREAEYERGKYDHLLYLIQKKIAKGKNLSQIAEELEETEDTIKELIKNLK